MNRIIFVLMLSISVAGLSRETFYNLAGPILESFTASNVTGNSLELSWTPSIDTSAISSFILYQNNQVYGWFAGADINASIIGLDPNSLYEFKMVILDVDGIYSDFSEALYILTTDIASSYCLASSFDYTYEYIDYVGLGEIRNDSSNGGYEDFTNLIANLTIGINTIELRPGFTNGTKYDESFVVWIDYNQNKIFEASEQIVSIAISAEEDDVMINFMVPSSANAGNTRMRVAMRYDGIPVACNSDFAYGEVEDYTVNIISRRSNAGSSRTIGDLEDQNTNTEKQSIEVFPNPADEFIYVNLDEQDNQVEYSLRDISGRLVQKGVLENKKITFGNLETGTYIFSIPYKNTTLSKQIIIR